MFFKLQKCFTIFKKLFLTEIEMQILTETQIPRDLTLRLRPFPPKSIYIHPLRSKNKLTTSTLPQSNIGFYKKGIEKKETTNALLKSKWILPA